MCIKLFNNLTAYVKIHCAFGKTLNLKWCGEKHGDFDKRYQLEDIAAPSLRAAGKVPNHPWIFLLNQRWYGAGREGIVCARSCWGTWKVNAALWCSCLAGAAWLFFPSAWWDRHQCSWLGKIDWCLVFASAVDLYITLFHHHFLPAALCLILNGWPWNNWLRPAALTKASADYNFTRVELSSIENPAEVQACTSAACRSIFQNVRHLEARLSTKVTNIT